VKNGKRRTVLVAGGAGFLGSHLCDAMVAEGAHVICLDNMQTGRRRNLRHLERDPRFDLIEHDIAEPLPASLLSPTLRIDAVHNLACAASPPHYQADPEHTMMTCVLGTRNLLRLAEAKGARLLMASTSEVYGDPEVHPQREDYWGHVNPTGPRACYDEGKRAAETLCFDYQRAGRAEVRVARIFNTYGRACAPMTAASSPTSSARRSRARTSPSTATAARRAPSATWTTWSTGWSGLAALEQLAALGGEPRQPGRAERGGAGGARRGDDRLPLRRGASPLPVDDPRAAARTSRWRLRCSAGSRASR
jgi:nucleoside-diphosphate-sugar epimerase